MKAKNKWKIVGAVLFVIVVLNWATFSDLFKNNQDKLTGKQAEPLEQIYLENTSAPDVYFCPRDDCAGELIAWLGAAEEYIHCAFFELGLENVRDALVERSSEVEVKLIVDNNYYDYVSDLDFARNDNRSGLMHNKFCVIDGKAVWTGSFNPTERGATKNNNNVIFYQSQFLAENYEEEFQEMWNGKFAKGPTNKRPEVIINNKTVENYFCPEDWCSNKLIYALQDANSSIYFMTFSFSHQEVGKQIRERWKNGVEVKGVFEKFLNRDYSEYHDFKEAGMTDMRVDGNPANMHHKVFIIDEKTVVTGSFNPSKNAETKNDENMLIIHDPDVAMKFIEEFERVWEEASPTT